MCLCQCRAGLFEEALSLNELIAALAAVGIDDERGAERDRSMSLRRRVFHVRSNGSVHKKFPGDRNRTNAELF